MGCGLLYSPLLNSLLQSEPGVQNNSQQTPISPLSSTSTTKTSPPPPLPPLLLLSSSPNKSSHLSHSQEPQATKAPLPKPRLRKPSRGEEAAATDESGSLPVPIARKRLGSRGQGEAGTSSEEIAISSSSSSSSSSAVAPPLLPRPKARMLVNSNKSSSPSVPAQQKVSDGGKVAMPTPRKRVNKKTEAAVEANYSRVQPKPTPTSATPTVNPYRSRKKGGGIRMPLWKAPPPPSWTPPPPSPVQGNSTKK